jgi:CRISPR-associated endonuclease/helicase Cas3
LFERYFQQYFGAEEPDKHGIGNLLTKDASQCVLQFRSAAERFRLIDDKNTWPVLVPYDERAEELLGLLRSKEINKGILRQLQRYTVTVYEHEFKKLRGIGAIEELQPDLWAVCVTNAYDKQRGLLMTDDLYSTDAASSVLS